MSEKVLNQMPNPEELDKIKEEYKDYMPEGQIEKDNSRGEVFDAGKSAGHKEILEMKPERIELEKIAESMNLSEEVKNIFVRGESGYDPKENFFLPDEKKLSEEQIIELIEKLPKIDSFDVCQARKSITRKVIDKFFERFPDSKVVNFYYINEDVKDEYLTETHKPHKPYDLYRVKNGYIFNGTDLRKKV